MVETDDEFTCTRSTVDYRDLSTDTLYGLVTGSSACSGGGSRELTHAFDGLRRPLGTEVATAEDPTDAGDKTTMLTFDGSGNPRTNGTYDNSTTTTLTDTVTTNPLNQVVMVVAADGSVTKSNYDAAGNLTDRCFWTSSTTETCHPVGYSYGDAPDTASTTGYDARNRRISLIGPATGESTYDPDADYQVKAVYTPTGTGKEQQTTYEYWPARHTLKKVTHQLCTISTGHSCSSTIAMGSSEYTLDGNDNRTKVIEDPTGATGVTRYYCYDPLDRLTKVSSNSSTCASGVTEQNAFDDAGNRTSTTGRTFTYNAAGQLSGCSPSCGTVDHDASGRLVHYDGWYLWYDPESRLIRACTTSGCTTTGNKVTFAYDGVGRRTKLTSTIGAGATTTIATRYMGDAVAIETNAAGTVTRTYVTDETGAIARICDPDCTGTNPQYLVTWNGHGDAQALWRIDAGGTLTLANSYTYSSWGVPTTATHNSIADLKFRFLYVGRFGVQWDDFGTGLAMQYMAARHYAPAIGRFLQPDPAALEINHYAYAGNNSATKIDPSGTLAFAEVMYCAGHPWACLVGSGISMVARDVELETFGTDYDGTKANAFKHCIWAGACAIALGPKTAKRLTDAHENIFYGTYFGGSEDVDLRMDSHNNAVSISIGRKVAASKGWGASLASNRTIVGWMKRPCLRSLRVKGHSRLTWYQ